MRGRASVNRNHVSLLFSVDEDEGQVGKWVLLWAGNTQVRGMFAVAVTSGDFTNNDYQTQKSASLQSE